MHLSQGEKRLARLSPIVAAAITMVACASPTNDDEEASDTSTAELGSRAPDATGFGALTTTSAEYRMAASVDPNILGDRKTEIWARMWRPSSLGADKHPLIVFLHGNHGTCGRSTSPRIDDSVQYTTLGTCPSGYVVTPNHLGYAYLAERLASWGYIVLSINANRGITGGAGSNEDFGLNLARGRLVLKHLQLLSEWNAQAGSTPSTLGVDLAGAIDFGNVGMMGHSRGGEGVRAAYALYNDAGSPWPTRLKSPLKVKGIFEIGPVDGQTNRTLNALGTAWNVLLPMCDGDVSDLQGMRPFDRMLATTSEAPSTATPKGMFAVWGANHNFYNTEWQDNDSLGCRGVGNTALWSTATGSQPPFVSTRQQTTALHALMGFFRAYVGQGAQPTFAQAYDPKFAIPQTLESITRVERAFTDAASSSNVRVLEDFTRPTGTSLSGQPTLAQGAGLNVTHGSVPEHDPMLKVARVSWTSASATTLYQIPWGTSSSSVGTVDASQMQTLDFRVSRQPSTSFSTSSPSPTLSFSIQLVNADGSTSSALKLRNYLELMPHAGHVILDTVRIPLADFTSATLSSIRGVRFIFDDTAQGAIYLSSLRLSRAVAIATPITPPIGGRLDPIGDPDTSPDQIINITTGNQLVGLRTQPTNGQIDVEVASQVAFPVSDSLSRLRIGNRDVVLSRYVDDGDTHRLVFTMSPSEFDAMPDGAPMTVRYGADRTTREWHFGAFTKTTPTHP